jgi:hypothetical protein
VTLGVSAVVVGYKIGGAVNRWLGISTRILGTTNDRTTFAGCQLWVDRWNFVAAGTDGWGPDRWQARFSQLCGTTTTVGQPIWDVPSNPLHAQRVAAADALFAAAFPSGTRYDAGIWFTYYIPATTVEAAATIAADEPLGGQWYGASAPASTVNSILQAVGTDPGASSTIADQTRSGLLSGDAATDLAVGQLVDPSWEGEPWAQPECRGLTVSACIDAVEAAAAQVALPVSITVVVTETPDPDVAQDLATRLVLGVGAIGRPSAVTIETNPSDGDPPGCLTRTDMPHVSAGAGGVISKGWASCNFAGEVVLTTVLWRCTDIPAPDLVGLLAGAWGCSIIGTNTEPRAVVPGTWTPSPVYSPPVGSPPIPWDASFIASSDIGGSARSFSPVLEPPA